MTNPLRIFHSRLKNKAPDPVLDQVRQQAATKYLKAWAEGLDDGVEACIAALNDKGYASAALYLQSFGSHRPQGEQ